MSRRVRQHTAALLLVCCLLALSSAQSQTRTPTSTLSETRTTSRTITSSPSSTKSVTETRTSSVSPTVSATFSRTPTPTKSISVTPTLSISVTAAPTPSKTCSVSLTSSKSLSPSAPESSTLSPSVTPTTSRTPSITPTSTQRCNIACADNMCSVFGGSPASCIGACSAGYVRAVQPNTGCSMAHAVRMSIRFRAGVPCTTLSATTWTSNDFAQLIVQLGSYFGQQSAQIVLVPPAECSSTSNAAQFSVDATFLVQQLSDSVATAVQRMIPSFPQSTSHTAVNGVVMALLSASAVGVVSGCDATCQTCVGPGISECTSCASGYVLDGGLNALTSGTGPALCVPDALANINSGSSNSSVVTGAVTGTLIPAAIVIAVAAVWLTRKRRLRLQAPLTVSPVIPADPVSEAVVTVEPIPGAASPPPRFDIQSVRKKKSTNGSMSAKQRLLELSTRSREAKHRQGDASDTVNFDELELSLKPPREPSQRRTHRSQRDLAKLSRADRLGDVGPSSPGARSKGARETQDHGVARRHTEKVTPEPAATEITVNRAPNRQRRAASMSATRKSVQAGAKNRPRNSREDENPQSVHRSASPVSKSRRRAHDTEHLQQPLHVPSHSQPQYLKETRSSAARSAFRNAQPLGPSRSRSHQRPVWQDSAGAESREYNVWM